MLLGVIADDFTGASDVGNTLARAGMATRLFVGDAAIDASAQAGVVALKSRSLPAAQAVAASLAALDRLLAAGCRQILFKYCSTFDSTPDGNIGPVAEALAARLGASGVVVCPAFPATGRTVYQGHLFVGDRLLSETGMADHPLTPMTDPDIRRWLARQSRTAPGHVPLATVRAGPAAIVAALAATGAVLAVVDATCDDDLLAIGAAAAGTPLVTGGSGVAMGLPGNFRAAGLLDGAASGSVAASGPALALAGSCSVATRTQVAAHGAAHPSFAIDVPALMAGAPVLEAALAFAAAHPGTVPLVHSSAEPAAVAALHDRFGREAVAGAVEELFGRIARDAVAAGVRRLIACGGETSGAVVEALAVSGLAIGGEIDPGVPALATLAPDGAPLALALKSGNFGGVDFIARAARALEGRP